MKITLLIILILVVSMDCFAQPKLGILKLTATDQNGAVIPQASITIDSFNKSSNKPSDFHETLSTDNDGFLRLSDIPSGIYRLTVEADGFYTRMFNQIKVRSGKTTSIKLDMGIPKNTEVIKACTIEYTKVVILIYASKADFPPNQVKPSIYIDGKEIAQISPLRYIMAGVNVGKHTINFNGLDLNSAVEAEFKLGQNYYVRLDWRKGKEIKPKRLKIIQRKQVNLSKFEIIGESDVRDREIVLTWRDRTPFTPALNPK